MHLVALVHQPSKDDRGVEAAGIGKYTAGHVLLVPINLGEGVAE
jgi:hypothetical protein